METKQIDQIIDRYQAQPTDLLAILQDIQAEENWLPQPALEHVADRLNIPVSRIYTMASFFKALSLEPRGKHICTVCMGTACHVRGAPRILDEICRELDVADGETSADGEYTVESVNCVGACALGPLVIVDGEYQGNMTSAKTKKLIKKLKD